SRFNDWPQTYSISGLPPLRNLVSSLKSVSSPILTKARQKNHPLRTLVLSPTTAPTIRGPCSIQKYSAEKHSDAATKPSTNLGNRRQISAIWGCDDDVSAGLAPGDLRST